MRKPKKIVRRERRSLLLEFIRQQILVARSNGLLGEEAFDHVVSEAIKFLDALITPPNPLLEALSDVGLMALKGVVGLLVQEAFDKLRADGQV